ncbi:hypothetical protein Tco_1229102 [Tanacetum coccineum]
MITTPESCLYYTTTVRSTRLIPINFSLTSMGDENPIRTLGDYSRPNYKGYQNTIDLPDGNNVVPLRSDTIRTAKLQNDILMFQQHQVNLSLKHGLDSRTYSKKRTIDQAAGGKLRDKNAEESWALLEDLALYDNESSNDPKDPIAKNRSKMAISLPQDVPSTSDRRLIELENQLGEKGIIKSGTKDDDHDTIVKIKEEFPPSSNAEFVCTKETDGDIMSIEIIKKKDDSCEGELGEDESVVTGELEVEYFDGLLTRSELAYHKYLMCAPIPSLFLRNLVIGLRIPEEEWRVKDTSLTHLKVFGCDSLVKVKDVYGEAMKCTFIGNGSDEIRHSFRDTKTHQVIRSRDTTFVDLICRARSVTDSSSLANPIQKSQVVLVDISENLAENDSRVAEYRLSSEITQSLGRSSDTSEGSKNSRSFEDSGRSDEEYSKDGASSKEGGSETPQVRRSTKESRASVRYSS